MAFWSTGFVDGLGGVSVGSGLEVGGLVLLGWLLAC